MLEAWRGFLGGLALRVVLAPLVVWLLAMPAGAATLEGQQFSERVQVASSELKLNGLGLRAVAIIKAYVVALYLQERADTEQAVLDGVGPKRIEIRMLREASAIDFNRALLRGIRKNASDEEMARLQERTKRMELTIHEIGKVREGDRITLDFDPARGMLIGLNGQTRGEPIAGADFYAAVLRIFIGQRPVDAALKRGLLG